MSNSEQLPVRRLRDQIAGLVGIGDNLDWTAVGRERWLASATIAALGLFSLYTQVLGLLRSTPAGISNVAVVTLVVPLIPLFLSVLIVGASIWLPRSEYGRFLPRIAVWCLGGAVVLVAIGQLIVLSQQLLGTTFGAPLFVLAYMQTIGTASGLVIGMHDAVRATALRDVTAERLRKQRLQVLNRVIRHNLRNDLNVVTEIGETIRSRTDDDWVESHLDTAVMTCRNLVDLGEKARVVNDVLADEPAREDVDLEVLLDLVAEDLQADWPESRIVVEDVGRAAIETDSVLVENALEAAIENGLEHNDADTPTVWLSVVDDGDEIEIRVRDNGPGIPRHEREVVESGSETALEHGSGIGLWLIAWCIRRLEGDISFEVNGGTTVVLRLPLHDRNGRLERLVSLTERQPAVTA